MQPSTRSERPQSSSRRSGSIAGSRSRIALRGALGGQGRARRLRRPPRASASRASERDVRSGARRQIVSASVSAETSTKRRRPRFEPFGPKPDPTPADGPDPYGNPDPEWLRIDWPRIFTTSRSAATGSTTPRSGRRGRAAPAGARLRPRALGLLAELAREHPPLRPPPPGDRARPARVRLLAGARLGDLDPRLRPAAARLLRRARRPRLRRGRQLDGRLRRRRGDDRPAGPIREARPRLRRRASPAPACAASRPRSSRG